jgi:hypothetical protein
MSRVVDHLASCSDKEVMKSLRPKQVLQAVKAVCALLSQLETLEVQEICEQLVKHCMEFDREKGNEDPSGRLRPEIVEEVGRIEYGIYDCSSTYTLTRCFHSVYNLNEIYISSNSIFLNIVVIEKSCYRSASVTRQ